MIHNTKSFNQINNIFDKCNIDEKAIIYCRSSTPQQNEFNHCSHQTQLFTCRQYCQDNNLKIINFNSETCSAKKIQNQKVLLNIIDNFENINIILFDASRFSRNLLEGVILLNKCKEKNIIIHNVKDGYSTKNHQGYLNFVDGIKNAEYESVLIGERIKASINYRKSLGTHIGRIPYGFKSEKINSINKIIKDDDEQLIINFIRDLYYGCTFNEANIKMLQITGKNIDSLFTEPCDNIEYGNFTFTMIADFLNENDIKHRNNTWTGSSVSIVTKTDPIVTKKKKICEIYDFDDVTYEDSDNKSIKI